MKKHVVTRSRVPETRATRLPNTGLEVYPGGYMPIPVSPAPLRLRMAVFPPLHAQNLPASSNVFGATARNDAVHF